MYIVLTIQIFDLSCKRLNVRERTLFLKKPCFQQCLGKNRELSASTMWPGSNPGVNSLCGLSSFLVSFSVLRGFSRNTQVFFSHLTLTHSWLNSKFNMYSVSNSVVVFTDNRLTRNTSLVAFFVGLR